MEMIRPDSPESRSADLIGSNLKRLKDIFPEAFEEGKINFDVLKELLRGEIDEKDERYGLNWNGKRCARQLALTPSMGTLRPCLEESVDWNTTQNLMLEGDNLEILKLLQKSYTGKIKLIYIDPPYNTGKDFVYPDDFRDNIKNYLELTGQMEAGRKITSNAESSGRFHTDWLNMMYPRIKLARNLLKEDGVIFMSIGDQELGDLLLMGNELFGEENQVGIITRVSKKPPTREIILLPPRTACSFMQKTLSRSRLLWTWWMKSMRIDSTARMIGEIMRWLVFIKQHWIPVPIRGIGSNVPMEHLPFLLEMPFPMKFQTG